MKYNGKIWYHPSRVLIAVPNEMLEDENFKLQFERNMLMELSEDGKTILIKNYESHIDKLIDSSSKKTL